MVFCEGLNSEPEYLREFARRRGAKTVTVELVPAAGVPKTLVERARAAQKLHARTTGKNSFSKMDSFWVAFDRDEHPAVAEAKGLARQLGIQVAFSNPCFEVWLLLHCESAQVDRPLHRSEAQRELEGLVESYRADRGKSPEFGEIEGGYLRACKGAQALRRRREEEGDPEGNPVTNFDELTEAIRMGAQGESRKQSSVSKA